MLQIATCTVLDTINRKLPNAFLTRCQRSMGQRYIPDVVLKNEGTMVQTCQNINTHVVNTASYMLGPTYFNVFIKTKQGFGILIWKHVGTQKISTQSSKLVVSYMHPWRTGMHNDGLMMQTCRNINLHVVNTDI